MIFLSVAFALFAICINILIEGERNITSGIEEKINCREFIKDFLGVCGDSVDKILIVKRDYQYNAFKNVIGIPNSDSNKIFDVISTLHEAGHYKILNENEVNIEIYRLSQYLIAVNRIIIIPLIVIAFLFFGKIYIMLIIFCLGATLIRLAVGITNEYLASRVAYQYIKHKFIYEYAKIAKKMYIYCFLNQLSLTLCIGFLMVALYFGNIKH
ncbi:MAG: hypothetical protein GX660_20770 [Clostridiaceae bacterium]|nr:hypothetical protein [Clostridiaceae bacterium]